MSVVCCGRKVASQFCPRCGRESGVWTLEGLLSHLRGLQAGQERISEQRAKQGGLSDAAKAKKQYAGLSRRADAVASKWRAWADQLQAMIEVKSPEVENL